MNKGEGAVFAAKAKSGQIGNLLFKETKPTKTKKFGYKKRTQTFPIRKAPTGHDSESENQPAQGQRNLSASSRSTNSHTDGNKPDRKKDFVKRNVQKVSGKTKEPAKDVNTIALTQDQLNAILKSIGHIASAESIASVTVENGDVKVSTSANESPQHKPDDTNKHGETDASVKTEDNDKSTTSKHSESIMALLAKQLPKTPSPVPSAKPALPNKAPEDGEKKSSSKSPKRESRHQMEKQTGEDKSKSPKAGDTGQVDKAEMEDTNRVEFAHLSLAERKRRKWKEELEEEAKLKHQQAAQDRHVRQVIASRMAVAHREASQINTQEEAGTMQTQSRNADNGDKFSPDNSPRGVAPSNLGVIATQRVVPAAMRSSFLIGGQGSAGSRLNDHNAQVKRQQQQEWLQELEKQRIEARERKEQEKRRQREYESGLTQQWAEPVALPTKTRQPVMGYEPHVQDDMAVRTHTDRQGEVEQPRSAPAQGSDVGGGVTATESSPPIKSHVRAYNLLLDPAEIERREAQRQKHLEHMLAVKAQVEEKQRLKKEADERRRQEEMEEEWRLTHQRRNLQEQFESEKDKQQRKQEEAAARHKALVESMQTAYQEAQQDKHRKRLDKLAKMGHDTSNLRRSWDTGQESSHEPVPQAPYKVSPRVDQPTVPQTLQHSPRHVMDQVTSQVTSQVTEAPVMVDAFTSPVYDQAVQTEFHFTPHEDVSLHDGHLERQASAHIEYKPDARPANRDPARKETYDKKRMRTVKEETQEGAAVRVGRQTGRVSRTSSLGSEQGNASKNAGKPVWGANTKSKKPQRNSDKDLTMSKRKREERRRQRAAELLAEQERNAPGRLAKGKKTKPGFEDKQLDPVHTGATKSKPESKRSPDRNRDHADHRERTESIRDRAPSGRDKYGNLPDTPPLKNGDFVPFLRSDEPVMSEDSVPVTPESRQIQRQRKPMKMVVAGDSDQERREDAIRSHAQTEKDPLLNPDRLKDTEHRQERILQQLSHLRQGLMLKQREMETILNPLP